MIFSLCIVAISRAVRSRWAYEAIPGSQLETIPRCAHLAQEDAPDTVVGYLTDFFGPQRGLPEAKR